MSFSSPCPDAPLLTETTKRNIREKRQEDFISIWYTGNFKIFNHQKNGVQTAIFGYKLITKNQIFMKRIIISMLIACFALAGISSCTEEEVSPNKQVEGVGGGGVIDPPR